MENRHTVAGKGCDDKIFGLKIIDFCKIDFSNYSNCDLIKKNLYFISSVYFLFSNKVFISLDVDM